MLQKFTSLTTPYQPGIAVYLVTRQGEILRDFYIKEILGSLVTLDRHPFPEDQKHVFVIQGDSLKPNWCAGRKHLVAGFRSFEQAEHCAARRRFTSSSR